MSYSLIESDEDTISATVLAVKRNYTPPELSTFHKNNVGDERRTRRDINIIPSTDEQAMSVVSVSPLEDERLKRLMTVSNPSYDEQKTADFTDRSDSPMAGDVTEVLAENNCLGSGDSDTPMAGDVTEVLDENNYLGSGSFSQSYDTSSPIRGNKYGPPELGGNVVEKWGFENDASDDSEIFHEASLKTRDRLTLTPAYLMYSRDSMLQAQNVFTEPATSSRDEDKLQDEMEAYSPRESKISTRGAEPMFLKTSVI